MQQAIFEWGALVLITNHAPTAGTDTGTQQEQLPRPVVKDLHQKKLKKPAQFVPFIHQSDLFCNCMTLGASIWINIKMKLFATKNPFPSTFMFFINIYSKLLSISQWFASRMSPNVCALGFTSTKSILQPQVCSPTTGKFLITAIFPGLGLLCQIYKQSQELPRTQEEMKLLPLTGSPWIESAPSPIPRVLPDGSWWKMGDLCSA